MIRVYFILAVGEAMATIAIVEPMVATVVVAIVVAIGEPMAATIVVMAIVEPNDA